MEAIEYKEYNRYSVHYLTGGNTPALSPKEPDDCGGTEPEEPEADANFEQRQKNQGMESTGWKRKKRKNH